MRPGERLGAVNREQVRVFFRGHIGCTQRECAAALKLSEMAVGRHIAKIRLEWEAKVKRKPR